MYNRDRGFGQHRSFAPIKVGEELDVKIEAVGEKGDGIAKVKGFVIFIPNTKAGEEVKIRITKVSKKVGFGEVIGEDSTPSKEPESTEDSESMEQESDDINEDINEDTDEEEAAEDSDTF